MSFAILFFLAIIFILVIGLAVKTAQLFEDNPADVPSGKDEDYQSIAWPFDEEVHNEAGVKGRVFSKAQNQYIPAKVVHTCRNGSVIVDTPRGLMRKRRIEF